MAVSVELTGPSWLVGNEGLAGISGDTGVVDWAGLGGYFELEKKTKHEIHD